MPTERFYTVIQDATFSAKGWHKGDIVSSTEIDDADRLAELGAIMHTSVVIPEFGDDPEAEATDLKRLSLPILSRIADTIGLDASQVGRTVLQLTIEQARAAAKPAAPEPLLSDAQKSAIAAVETSEPTLPPVEAVVDASTEPAAPIQPTVPIEPASEAPPVQSTSSALTLDDIVAAAPAPSVPLAPGTIVLTPAEQAAEVARIATVRAQEARDSA